MTTEFYAATLVDLIQAGHPNRRFFALSFLLWTERHIDLGRSIRVMRLIVQDHDRRALIKIAKYTLREGFRTLLAFVYDDVTLSTLGMRRFRCECVPSWSRGLYPSAIQA